MNKKPKSERKSISLEGFNAESLDQEACNVFEKLDPNGSLDICTLRVKIFELESAGSLSPQVAEYMLRVICLAELLKDCKVVDLTKTEHPEEIGRALSRAVAPHFKRTLQ